LGDDDGSLDFHLAWTLTDLHPVEPYLQYARDCFVVGRSVVALGIREEDFVREDSLQVALLAEACTALQMLNLARFFRIEYSLANVQRRVCKPGCEYCSGAPLSINRVCRHCSISAIPNHSNIIVAGQFHRRRVMMGLNLQFIVTVESLTSSS
jgi:hypothetical protein